MKKLSEGDLDINIIYCPTLFQVFLSHFTRQVPQKGVSGGELSLPSKDSPIYCLEIAGNCSTLTFHKNQSS
jgi:hypothetical protein